MENQEQTPSDPALISEIEQLRREFERMNNHRFIRLHDSIWRLGLFQLYRGLAFGLGSVLGATILVSLLGYMLASIDFIPVLGDWATQILEEIQGN